MSAKTAVYGFIQMFGQFVISLLIQFIFQGYNDELDALEKKVEAAAKDRIAASLKDGTTVKKIRLSEVVAVFVPGWHKYIRAAVKKRDGDDLYYVWAIDYGVPMMVHATNIVKLQAAFSGMKLTRKRVHLGGMENCLPAEKQFNIANECSDKRKLLNWTPQAIDLVQKLLSQAIKLEFEHIEDLLIQKRPHYFGRLMMQRPSDGQMINVVKSLLEMNMAVLAEREFKIELKSIESLNQSIIFSANNELLDVKTCVCPVKTVANDIGYSNSEIYENESENESFDEDVGDLPIEDNEFFDESASVMQPKLRRESISDDTLATVPENQLENNADRSNSNAIQAKSKSNQSNGKSDIDAENNNNEKQQPKNANKNRDRKQRNKSNSNVSNQSNQSPNQQQQQQAQQKQKPQQLQQQPQKQPTQQPQKQNHQQHQQQQQHPHQQFHRQPMSFNQSGPQQRALNGEQNQNHSNFQHPHHPKSIVNLPVAQNHYRAQGMRNAPDAAGRFNGFTEFEASFRRPPPRYIHPSPFMNPPYAPPPPMLGPIPPKPSFQLNFKGMYGPASSQPGTGQSHPHPHPPRNSNMRSPFHENPTKQAQHLMSVLNIQSQNHPSPNNSANQRGQNRMRNRNSAGFQGRNNQSVENAAAKVNGNGNNVRRDDPTTDGIKPAVKKSPAPSKVNSEKSVKTVKSENAENAQTTGEQVE